MNETQPGRVRFGVFELDMKSGELCSGGQRSTLREQPLQILRMLIEREGELVSREEIRKKLWPNDTIVEFDHSINAAIRNLRRTLGDSADAPAYVETVARRGYRLMVTVFWLGAEDSSDPNLSARAAEDRGMPPAPGSDADPITLRTEPQPAVLTGRTVSHYRVLDVIGGGGMGVVYRAEDLKLGRRVALKFLPEDLGSDSHALERFSREARAASSLDHPNICSIFEFGDHEGRPFIVMQLLEGETLRDRLAKNENRKPLPLEELLKIGIQVSEGLQAAHELGIIHRDIKPANIFLTSKGVCKILDFGLAKLMAPDEKELAAAAGATGGGDAQVGPHLPRPSPAETLAGQAPSHAGPAPGVAASGRRPTTGSHLTRTDLAVGTAGYMSPEQVRGEKLDARSDLFSFGLVLYEMATGQRAFCGETAILERQAVLHGSPVPVQQLNPTLPTKLVTTIDKALEKDRDRRYQSAAAICTDLEAVQRGLEVTFPVPGPEPVVRRRWPWLVTAAVVAAILAAAWFYWHSRSPALSSKDTIVLADFANSTGDPVFDGSLKEALSIQLEQSPFLNVLSEARVNETLKLMSRPANQRLTREVAQEVCQRTNSKALLTGSISAIGDHYEIALRALDCGNGSTLASSQAEAENRNQVLKALQQAGNELRGKLGESLASVAKFNLPLAQATTSSLEALQAYTQARTLSGGGTDAIPYLLRAVELDPSFAMAQLRLGVTYFNLNEPSLAAQRFAKAYELRDRVSERERLTIESYHYAFGTGELEKAMEIYARLIQSYPDDYDAHADLANVYAELGQYDKALAESKERVRLAPGYEPDANVVGIYANLGRFNEAHAAFEQARSHKDNQYLEEAGYSLAFLRGDRAAMQQALAWGMGKPGVEDWLLSAQSDTEAYYGRFNQGRELCLRAVESAKRAGSLETAAIWHANEAMREAEISNMARARQAAADSLTLSAGPETEVRAAIALARAGEVAQAQKLADKLNRAFPLDTRMQYFSIPAIGAAIELQTGNPAKALSILELTTPYELGGPTSGIAALANLYPAYLRGQAYMKTGQGELAAGEFRKLINHHGIVGNFVTGALARLQLARAQAMTGDKAAAHQSYEEFLTLWKDADPDIPIYQQAKAEYAKLR
jgi:serine/threonine protein kinase/DNA-binding winged helix-turn-helix (wHTH) protein/Tfp pilus assembly protein PilF